VSGVELPREENRGPTQDLVVLPQPPDLGLQALDLGRLLAGHARTGSVVDLGLGQPAPHGLARDALLTGDRGHRRSHGGVLLGVLAHEPHAPRAQLGIDLLRHAVYPLGLKQQRHQTRDGSQRGWRLGISVVPPVSGWVWWYSWMWSIWLAQEVGGVQPGTAQTGKVRRRYSSISGVGAYRSAGRGRNAPVVGSVRTRCQVFSEPASWRAICGEMGWMPSRRPGAFSMPRRVRAGTVMVRRKRSRGTGVVPVSRMERVRIS